MILRNAFPISLALLSSILLISCGSGPKLTYCISSPSENLFRCHDPKNNKPFQKTPEKLIKDEAWTCMSGIDATAVLDACNEKRVPPKRNQCIIGEASEDFLFHCYNQKTGLSENRPFASTENYVCLSVNEFLFLLDYCTRKREGN
jgi:hypothetical protein